MTKDEAMRLALDALEHHTAIKHPQQMHYRDTAIEALRQALSQPDDASWAKHLKEPMSEKRVYETDKNDSFNRLVRIMNTFDLATGHADNWNGLLDSLESELRDVLGYYRETFKVEQECSTHPDAPHGFNRDASHNYGRYVCDCEGWEPPNVSQEPQTMPEKTDDVAQETQPEQKPVAWLDIDEDEAYSNSEIDEEAKTDLTPLYTAPPSKPWVSLTDEEILSHTEHIGVVRYFERLLREKNYG